MAYSSFCSSSGLTIVAAFSSSTDDEAAGGLNTGVCFQVPDWNFSKTSEGESAESRPTRRRFDASPDDKNSTSSGAAGRGMVSAWWRVVEVSL